MSAARSFWRISRRFGRGGPASRASLLADQRGAVAFEMLIVFGFLIIVLLLPLADMAIFGFKYISAWQALRAFGQSIQYSPPDDVTQPGDWVTRVTSNTSLNYAIKNLQIMCIDNSNVVSICSGSPPPPRKYFSFNTSFSFTPMPGDFVVIKALGCQPTCTYTLPYSERFQ
jgi:hypothetical protein